MKGMLKMFSPCSDGKCVGRDRSGWGNHECRDCELTHLRDEVSSLNFKIRNELEPRIKSERRSYDNWVINPER
jgi:Zn-finger protein